MITMNGIVRYLICVIDHNRLEALCLTVMCKMVISDTINVTYSLQHCYILLLHGFYSCTLHWMVNEFQFFAAS